MQSTLFILHEQASALQPIYSCTTVLRLLNSDSFVEMNVAYTIWLFLLRIKSKQKVWTQTQNCSVTSTSWVRPKWAWWVDQVFILHRRITGQIADQADLKRSMNLNKQMKAVRLDFVVCKGLTANPASNLDFFLCASKWDLIFFFTNLWVWDHFSSVHSSERLC